MNNNKFFFIAMIFLVSLVCISAVSAADDAASDIVADANDATVLDESIDDADLADGQNDELTQNDENVLSDGETPPPLTPSFNLLSDKIVNGGDEVNLDDNYFYSDYDENFVSGINITRNVTINGNGHTIDGKDTARIFYVKNNLTVTLKDINFVNAYSGWGSAIYCTRGSNVTILNCNFTANHATSWSGAVYADNSEVTAINCIFKDNLVDYCSGATCDVNAIGCTFINNSAKATYSANTAHGGAMCGGTATNCNFIGNSADVGGALDGVNATNCTFTGNVARRSGGAIYSGHAIDCTFKDNNASWYGGAICSVDASNCNFINNFCSDNGGAMTGCTAVNCNFTNNTATNGGALEAGRAVNCNFIGNNATNGGALYESNATNCVFKGNTALAEGNALYGGYADSCIFNGDTSANADIALPVFNTFNFVSTYNSGQKLLFNITTRSGIPLNDANVKINLYTTSGSLVGTYNALSSGWKVPLNPGTYKAVCTVAGYDVTAEGLIVIEKIKTAITSSAVTAVYNNNKYLVITLKDSKGNVMKGAKVTVTLASAKTYTTDSKGQIKVAVGKLVPKTYTAKIAYAGNTYYQAASKSVKVVVKKATPKMTAKAKSFKVSATKKYTITLKNNINKVMKSTKVTLTVNKKTFTAKTNSKGVATFKITNLKKKGGYAATIKYAGSKYYNKLTKKAKITVTK